MRDAVIVGAVRTAVGRKGGKLSGIRPDDLAALVLKDLVARLKVDPAEIEDVILGCAAPEGTTGCGFLACAHWHTARCTSALGS